MAKERSLSLPETTRVGQGMHRMKKKLTILSLSVIIVALAFSGFGKVFWKWRPARSYQALNVLINGRSLLESPVTINGASGNLSIIGCNADLPSVISQLRVRYASCQKIMDFQESASMGWGIIIEDEYIRRIIVLNLHALQESMMFLISQTFNNYRNSLKTPLSHSPQFIPSYPGSMPGTAIHIAATAADLTVSSATGLPESICSFFQTALTSDGWQNITPIPNLSTENTGFSISIYKKRAEICCILVQPSAETLENTITVLHKRLKVK